MAQTHPRGLRGCDAKRRLALSEQHMATAKTGVKDFGHRGSATRHSVTYPYRIIAHTRADAEQQHQQRRQHQQQQKQ